MADEDERPINPYRGDVPFGADDDNQQADDQPQQLGAAGGLNAPPAQGGFGLQVAPGGATGRGGPEGPARREPARGRRYTAGTGWGTQHPSRKRNNARRSRRIFSRTAGPGSNPTS